MADFKTHTLVGTGVGLSMSYFSYIKNWSNELFILILIYILAIIGSFLPDLDADSGRPVRIIFTFFGLIGAGMAFLITYYIFSVGQRMIIMSVVLTFLIIRYILSFIFRKLTKHRGIFHSLPMMLVFFLLIFSFTSMFQISLLLRLIFSLTVMFGFLSHLILDEIYATKNFMGIPYKMNKSFGNALKLTSRSERVNSLVYVILIILLFINFEDLTKIF